VIRHRIRARKAPPPRQQNRVCGPQLSKPETKVGVGNGTTADAPLEAGGAAGGGRTMKKIGEKTDRGLTSGVRGNVVRRKSVEGEGSVGSIQLRGGGRFTTFSSVYPNPLCYSCITIMGLLQQFGIK
ncbi:hypothetical protein HOY82DRAFT_479182, partial [Tuber indicum]